MKTTRGACLAVTVAALLMLAMAAGAAEPEKPPAGQAKYLIVLWDAGTPVPGRPDERIKRVPEPDVEKLGGRTLAKQANRRVVFLPVEAARQLRKHQAVSFVQRIWTGEPFTEWNETAPAEASARPDRIAAEADPTLSWEREYGYDGEGNITSIGNDQFDYDGLGRLTGAMVAGSAQGYIYDGFGNLTAMSTPEATVAIPTDPSTNRMAGQTYDAAGNVTSRKDQGRYVYDSLNMVVGYSSIPGFISPRRILYDANDERIGTIVDESLQQWTIRDFDGQILREFRGYDNGLNLVWSWEQDHVRGGGQLVGGERVAWSFYYEDQSAFTYGGKRHYHLDHLGSVRVVTDQAGRAVAENDFYPYGKARTRQYQEQLNWGQPHVDGMRFAGHWRDFMGHPEVESDDYLDAMHARYYDPNLGRFLSVDPVIGKGALRNPQMWNRYAYVMNNPLRYVDPDGRLLQLSECVKSTTNSGCQGQYNLLLSTFGKQSADAAKHLTIGKNGMVSITGMSGGAFAAKFGLMGRATTYLVSNRAATFTVNTGRTEGAANFVDREGGGGNINVDVAAFKGGKMLGGVSVSATEALVHEMAHAVSTLFQGHAETRNSAWGTSILTKASPRNEAYATVFENAWRRLTYGMGVPIRDGYFAPGDVRDPASPDFFP